MLDLTRPSVEAVRLLNRSPKGKLKRKSTLYNSLSVQSSASHLVASDSRESIYSGSITSATSSKTTRGSSHMGSKSAASKFKRGLSKRSGLRNKSGAKSRTNDNLVSPEKLNAVDEVNVKDYEPTAAGHRRLEDTVTYASIIEEDNLSAESIGPSPLDDNRHARGHERLEHRSSPMRAPALLLDTNIPSNANGTSNLTIDRQDGGMYSAVNMALQAPNSAMSSIRPAAQSILSVISSGERLTRSAMPKDGFLPQPVSPRVKSRQAAIVSDKQLLSPSSYSTIVPQSAVSEHIPMAQSTTLTTEFPVQDAVPKNGGGNVVQPVMPGDGHTFEYITTSPSNPLSQVC